MTPTSMLLNQCGWLSIRQLVQYQSLVLMFKVRADKKPQYIYTRIGDCTTSRSRQEAYRVNSRLLKDFRGLKSETARKTFIPRTVAHWNSLPIELRMIDDISSFKIQLKTWIQNNVPCKWIRWSYLISCFHCKKSMCLNMEDNKFIHSFIQHMKML